MKISNDKWVSIHYTLKDDAGTVIDSSEGKEPLGYLHGHGYLITGLENELEGKEQGAKFTAVIQPKDGYGEYEDDLCTQIPRDRFETDQEILVGMQFQAMSPRGPILVRVVDVKDEVITVDANHELAGKVLHFDVEVVEVREATEEELKPQGCGGGCGGCGGDGGCDGDCGGDCNCGEGGCGGEGCGCNS